MKSWFMYVLTCADKSFYCGITTNIKLRVEEHNGKKSGAKYTRSRRPVCLLYSESHFSRSTASQAEYRFKKLTRKAKIRYMVEMCEKAYDDDYKAYKANLEKDVPPN